VITELERYHGVVLRQLLVAHGHSVSIGVANLSGRVDAFSIEGGALQIKHSAKRLSPWQFTYMPENLEELIELQRIYDPVWAILVCGGDGVVGLSLDELNSIVGVGDGGAAWIRISRGRNSMYRVRGTLGELARAKPRGVEPFLAEVFKQNSEVPTK
jgi:hypothetical protein